jgi:hypothetical protein
VRAGHYAPLLTERYYLVYAPVAFLPLARAQNAPFTSAPGSTLNAGM